MLSSRQALRLSVMEKLRVIYIGNPEFAINPLKALLQDSRFQVTSVVCSNDKEAFRGKKLIEQPVCQFAKLNKLIIHKTEKIKEFDHALMAKKPDFLVVFAYGYILPSSILKIPTLGCINIHPSLLPKYRGPTPVQEALLNGDRETGVTLISMNESMDSGDILWMESAIVEESDNADTLTLRLSKKASDFLPKVLKDFANGSLKLKPQDHSKATYCRKIKKEDGKIDFKKETAEEILRKIRAYTPWPSAYFFLDGKRIKILSAKTSAASSASADFEQKISSGSIERIKDKLIIGTVKGVLIPLFIQSEGKKPLPIEEFLKGYRDSIKIS